MLIDMKIFTVLLLFFSLNILFSKPAKASHEFLKCLGQEELYIHKNKIGGSYEFINREMINISVQLRDSVRMRSRFEKMLCHKSIKFPSLKLLEFFIEGHSIFYSSSAKGDIVSRSLDKKSIKELYSNSARLFIRFISVLQSELKVPNCLQKNIPELSDFIIRGRYTLEDIGLKQLINELKNKDIVFSSLLSRKLHKVCNSQK